MFILRQIKDGQTVFEAEIKDYKASVDDFIKNGATKISIEYPDCIVELVKKEGI